MIGVRVLRFLRTLSRDMLRRLRTCELLPCSEPGEDARLALAVLGASDMVSLLLRFSLRAAISLVFRALTRSWRVWLAGVTRSSVFRVPVLATSSIRPMVIFRRLTGGDGEGRKSGMQGLSGTSGSIRFGAGRGLSNAFEACPICGGTYPCGVSGSAEWFE